MGSGQLRIHFMHLFKEAMLGSVIRHIRIHAGIALELACNRRLTRGNIASVASYNGRQKQLRHF